MIRVNTIAMLDGSIRTVELGTLEAIELCRDIAKQSDHDVKELGYYADWHGGWFYIETIDEGEAE